MHFLSDAKAISIVNLQTNEVSGAIDVNNQQPLLKGAI